MRKENDTKSRAHRRLGAASVAALLCLFALAQPASANEDGEGDEQHWAQDLIDSVDCYDQSSLVGDGQDVDFGDTRDAFDSLVDNAENDPNCDPYCAVIAYAYDGRFWHSISK